MAGGRGGWHSQVVHVAVRMVCSSVMSSDPAEGCMFFVVSLGFFFFFLINDSFLAFVTSSSLLVVGTKWSSRPLPPALPVQETDFRKPLSVSRWGPLQLWFSLQMSENGGFCCPQNSKQPLGLVKTRSTPIYSLLSSCTSFLALQDANGCLNREQSRRWGESSRMTD